MSENRKVRHVAVLFLVYNFDDEVKVLLGRHNGYGGVWLPPGGGLKEYEDHLQAAVREAEEEVGVSPGKISIYVDPTAFTYTSSVTRQIPLPMGNCRFPRKVDGEDDVAFSYYGQLTGNPELRVDGEEFSECHWFGYQELLTEYSSRPELFYPDTIHHASRAIELHDRGHR